MANEEHYDFKIVRNGIVYTKRCETDFDPRHTVRLGWYDELPFASNPGLALRCTEGFDTPETTEENKAGTAFATPALILQSN